MPGLWWPQGAGPALVRVGWEGSFQRPYERGAVKGLTGGWTGLGGSQWESWRP